VNPSQSISATNRKLVDWFIKVNSGEIKLPRFQRFEAWDRHRISGLLTVVANNLPLGITLLLEVNETPLFVDRYLKTAPQTGARVTEHLLDGQQRLTAFWRMMHNNYDDVTYYLQVPGLAKSAEPDEEADEAPRGAVAGYSQGRWYRNDNTRYPLWADKPAECYQRNLIPAQLLRPVEMAGEVEEWLRRALPELQIPVGTTDSGILMDYIRKQQAHAGERERIKALITGLRETVKHYNLPYLALPVNTAKEVALNVFINMNTNSKPLSLYDIIVAEVESVMEQSLHDLEKGLDAAHPNLKHYANLGDLILNTSSLLQDKLPNQRGHLDMNKSQLVTNWNMMRSGLVRMAALLESQRIYDRQRLPTTAVLAVLAALLAQLPDAGDQLGQAEVLLRKYLWTAFFTERYENASASRAFADYRALKNVTQRTAKSDGSLWLQADVPIFNSTEYPLLYEPEQLITVNWPKGENIRGRGILAVANYQGAYDFADGQPITREHLQRREYHHIFPDALLREAGIDSGASYVALNCALITDKTNRTISCKEPIRYLKERYQWTEEALVDQRLGSHLIPVVELAQGNYDKMAEEQANEKIRFDYAAFLRARAQLISQGAKQLCSGHTALHISTTA
jgi:hypothetical protein